MEQSPLSQQNNITSLARQTKVYIVIGVALALVLGAVIGKWYVGKTYGIPGYVADIPKHGLDLRTKEKRIFVLNGRELWSYALGNARWTMVDKGLSLTGTALGESIIEGVGPMVAYVSNAGARKELMVSDVHGNKLRIFELEGGAEESYDIFLNEWSPNNLQLLFAVAVDTGGIGQNSFILSARAAEIDRGFYVADLNGGKIYKLAVGAEEGQPWESLGWLDNNTILFSKGDALFSYSLRLGRPVPFEKQLFPQGKKPFAFRKSKVSERGTFSYETGELGDNPNSQIYFFDGEAYRLVKDGGWAENQFSLISPDGSLIAYSRFLTENTFNQKAEIHIYHVKDGKDEVLPFEFATSFMSYYWWNNTRLVVKEPGSELAFLSVYDVINKKQELIVKKPADEGAVAP